MFIYEDSVVEDTKSTGLNNNLFKLFLNCWPLHKVDTYFEFF